MIWYNHAMDAFEGILGLSAQKMYLNRVLETGLVNQAFCFSGPKHLGKSLLAKRFTASLLGTSHEQLLTHPDVQMIGRSVDEKTGEQKSQISIEVIRTACNWLQLSSVSGGKKVLIVEDADTMTVSAQNAFLKTLEEPHAGVLIILIATQPGRLLDTILSRLTHIRCTRTPREEICEALVARGTTKERAHMIAGAAAGRPGLAFELLDAEPEELPNLLGGAWAQRIAEIQSLTKGSSSAQLLDVLDRVLMSAHDGLLHAAGCGHMAGSEVQSERTVREWTHVLTALLEARTSLTQNGNPAIAFERFSLSV